MGDRRRIFASAAFAVGACGRCDLVELSHDDRRASRVVSDDQEGMDARADVGGESGIILVVVLLEGFDFALGLDDVAKATGRVQEAVS